MNDSPLLDHLRLVAVRSGALRDHLSSLLGYQYPHDDVEAVLKAVSEAVDEISGRAQSDAARGIGSPNPARKTSALRRLRRHLRALSLIHSFLGYFQGADLALLPGMLVPVLNGRTRPYLPSAVLAVHGWELHNYSYVSAAWLNKVFEEAGLQVRVPDTFGVLAFPAAESRNILACCVLAHEAGHFVCESLNLVGTFFTNLSESARTEIASAAKTYAVANGATPQERVSLLRAFLDAFEAWLKELYADALGLRLLGPASLFAMREQTLKFDPWSDESDDHPAWSMRAAYAIDGFLTAADGWGDSIAEQVGPVWASIIEAGAAVRPVGKDPLLDGVYEVVVSQLDPAALRAAVDAATPVDGDCILSAEHCLTQLKAAVELLERGLVPGEIVTDDGSSTYVNPLTALLAGWVFKAKGMPKWGMPEDSEIVTDPASMKRVYGLDRALNDYVAKALEIHLVGTAWREPKPCL